MKTKNHNQSINQSINQSKKLLLILLMLIASFGAFAQIYVDQYGDVTLTNDVIFDHYINTCNVTFTPSLRMELALGQQTNNF